MTYATDLLDQADGLCELDPRRPKQANLRRAISAAYYALFHQLIEDAVRALLPARQEALRLQLRRRFEHGKMKKVAQATASRRPSPAADLVLVAGAFVALQEVRHEADYDFSRSFSKAEAVDHVRRAREAVTRWTHMAASEERDRFLIEQLTGRLDA